VTSDALSQSFHLANDHVNNGRHEEALAIFEKLVAGDADAFTKTMACVNLAIVHDKIGQIDQALKAYDRGIQLDRGLGRFFVAQHKANYCIEKERHAEALAALGALVESSISEMDKANACLSAATVCEKLGQVDKALEWYDRGIKYEYTHHRFNVAEHKAWYLSSKGRTKESLKLYERLVREASMTEADKERLRNNISLLDK
jgi:tetratricopeptide (TPR) repeat protein